MIKKLKLLEVQRVLKERDLRLFSRLEFQSLFKVSPVAATFFLFNHTHDGFFVRLKNGLYSLSDSFPIEEEIANRLYKPSYLSFEYALARYGIIPESVYPITSATPSPTREFNIEGKLYEYFTIKKKAYAGYIPQKISGQTILIATPEKAFVDTLYFVQLGKRSLNDRYNLSSLSKKDVFIYAKLFDRPTLIRTLKELL